MARFLSYVLPWRNRVTAGGRWDLHRSDLGLEKERIRWPTESNKIGFLDTTDPLRPALDAVAAARKPAAIAEPLGYFSLTSIQQSCRATPPINGGNVPRLCLGRIFIPREKIRL